LHAYGASGLHLVSTCSCAAYRRATACRCCPARLWKPKPMSADELEEGEIEGELGVTGEHYYKQRGCLGSPTLMACCSQNLRAPAVEATLQAAPQESAEDIADPTEPRERLLAPKACGRWAAASAAATLPPPPQLPRRLPPLSLDGWAGGVAMKGSVVQGRHGYSTAAGVGLYPRLACSPLRCILHSLPGHPAQPRTMWCPWPALPAAAAAAGPPTMQSPAATASRAASAGVARRRGRSRGRRRWRLLGS